jgi:hypothetical protein
MAGVAVSIEPRKTIALKGRRWVAALGAAIVAVFWFPFLAAWLGVGPGAVLLSRNDVLFDSDMNFWVWHMMEAPPRGPGYSVHPLALLLWRTPSRALASLAGLFMAPDRASIFGPTLLVALIAAAGVGFLAYLALHLGVRPLRCALLFACYLLFTSNTTAALPEHFGISNGLLSITFVLFALVANQRVRVGILSALAVLCAGTTIPNGLFPAYCIFVSVVKSSRLKLRMLLAAISTGLAAAAVLDFVSGGIRYLVNVATGFFKDWASFRLLTHPLQALIYSLYMLVLPVVGGTPSVHSGGRGWLMVTYEPAPRPLDFSYYFGIQGIGAILWLVLLARSVQLGLRDTQTRPYAHVLLAWLLYNMLFFNVWGSELILYSPAWSWTLIALVILAARHLSRTLMLVTILPIAVCQLIAFHEIKNLLLTIPK